MPALKERFFRRNYSGGLYAKESRRVNKDQVAEAVVLDSVQSQANRIEDALLRAFDEGRLSIPVMAVDVPGHGRVTSLDAPHRIADAIFRDSMLDGRPFHHTDAGKRFLSATSVTATAVFEFCPTALVLGYWNSQAGLGTRAAKVARALCSEIVGYGPVFGVQTGGRLDPLGIPSAAATIYESAKSEDYWTLSKSDARKEKGKEKLFGKGKPSDINHGNVPPDVARNDRKEPFQRGATLERIEQTVVLSLAQLRRLRFPSADGKPDTERDAAGRSVLAALGLTGVALAFESGYELRSRCTLFAPTAPELELVGGDGRFELSSEQAIVLLNEAYKKAKDVGLTWRAGLIPFEPQPKLIELFQKGLNVRDAEEE